MISPVYKLLTCCLSTLVLSSIGYAQSTISLGETRELPSPQRKSDHALLTMNSEGDIMVVWQESSAVAGFDVYGVVVTNLGGGSWRIPASSQLLGSSGPLPNGNWSSLQKPDIESIGEDFLVVWPRYDTEDNDRPAILEAVLVHPDGSVERPQFGVGYRVSPEFNVGGSGANVRIAKRVGDGEGIDRRVVAVYVHQSGSQTVPNGELNDYDLRAIEMDISLPVPSSRPLRVPGLSNTVVGKIPNDALNTYRRSERLPPFVIQDGNGDLLIAYEEYVHRARGLAADHESSVWLRRFRFKGQNQLQALDSLQLRGDEITFYQRRPNLTMNQSGFEASVAWLELNQQGKQGRGQLARVDLSQSPMQLIDQKSVFGCSGQEILDARSAPELTQMIGVRSPESGSSNGQELFVWSTQLPGCGIPFNLNVDKPRRPAWFHVADIPFTQVLDPVTAVTLDDSDRVYLSLIDYTQGSR